MEPRICQADNKIHKRALWGFILRACGTKGFTVDDRTPV